MGARSRTMAPMNAPRSSPARLLFSMFALGLMVAALGYAWWGGRTPPAGAAGEAFERIRQSILEGDRDVLWRSMDGEARERYAGYIKHLRGAPEGPDARAWMGVVGVSREDLGRLPLDVLMARETAALAGLMKGARVSRTHPQGADEEVLEIIYGDGSTHWWHLGREDGRWVVRNLATLLDREGRLLEDGLSRHVPARRDPALDGLPR